jgi:2-methylcitrate dehydratase PrpD
LREQHGPAVAAVSAIRLKLDKSCDRVCNIPAPVDGLQSKFSLRQTVAMALAGIDTAGLDSYSERNALDPALIGLRERIAIDFQEGWPNTLAELDVTLADGRQVSARYDAGIAEADIALQGRQLAAKFDALVEPLLGRARARELREAVAALDRLSDIGDIARLAAA